MSKNSPLFGKKDMSLRVHMDEDKASDQLAKQLLQMTKNYEHRDLVIICIGTDRSTGDSLGPLIGTKLQLALLRRFHVYGTLENPLHAVNLVERLEEIHLSHRRPFILAIDACLGRLNSIGSITLSNGPIQPGSAVNKKLPEVGDMHMTGIVNIGGMMEYFVLQNTRLYTVMKMADTIAAAIEKVDHLLPAISAPSTLLAKFRSNSTSYL